MYVRIGHENELPAMHSLALVATGYGLAQRKLGTVSVIGPVRMDYAGAIATVREAAHRALALRRGRLRRELSQSACPATPTRCSASRATPPSSRSRRPFAQLARELHPDVNAHDPDAEEKFKEAAEAYEILSDAERRATYDRYGHDGLRSGGYAPNFDGFGSISDLFNAFFGGAAPGAPGRRRAATSAWRSRSTCSRPRSGAKVEVAYEAVERCEHCHGNGAEPGTPIETCERCGGAGQLQAVTRTPFGQMVRTCVCDVCHGDGRVPEQPCRECRGAGRVAATRTLEVDVPAGIADGQRIRLGGHGHAGEAGAPPGDLYVLVQRPRGRALRARRRRPDHGARRRRSAGGARRRRSRCPRSRAAPRSSCPRAPSRARC